jgi:hypothetical protein
MPKKNVFIADLMTKQEKQTLKKQSGGDDSNFEERIKYFKAIRALFSKNKIKTKSCLAKAKTATASETSHYSLGNNDCIVLTDIIGKGVYGIVYRAIITDTTFINEHPNSKFLVAKLMQTTEENKRELKLNVSLSNRILKEKISRHFMLCYKVIECTVSKYSFSRPMKIPELGEGSYLVSFNEIATNDIENLLKQFSSSKKEDSNKAIGNILVQCLLSIMTFHKLGWIHQDTHTKNFLYKTDSIQGGYYHYIILGHHYYIPHYGYTIMINDFGESAEYTKEKPSLFEYHNSWFHSHQYGNRPLPKIEFIYDYNDYRVFLISSMMTLVSSNFSNEETFALLESLLHMTQPNKYQSENNLITQLLKTMQDNMLIFSELPDGETVINLQPYIIDDTLSNKMPKNLPSSISTPESLKSPAAVAKSQSIFTTLFSRRK